LGACYLDKLQRLSQGYDFDRETFEAAHRNLMLAYDLGRDNARIKASALMDLGLLHQRVQNHGLAAKFFAKRKDLGFISDEDSARFAWFYGQSLFYSNQPDKAADELGRVVNPKNYSGPLLDRWAFYLQAAGKYESATQAYQKLFQSGFLKGDLNLAKAYLGYGFSLFKLKRETEARTALNQSLDHASHLQILPKDQDRLMDFLPVRLQLDAFGLLAQTGTKAERLDALEKRGDLLTAAKVADNTELFDDGLSLLIQNRLQIAKLDPARSARMIQDSLRLAEKLGDSGQYLSHAVYQVAVDSLENGILHPEFSSPAESASIRKLVDKSIHAYEAQRNAQPVLEHQKLKLQILWTAYSSKVLKTANGAQELQKLLAASPEHALELKPLATALASITSQP
jgi:hypothetical protein